MAPEPKRSEREDIADEDARGLAADQVEVSSGRPRRSFREPIVNAIQATRKPRKNRSAIAEPGASESAPAGGTSPADIPSTGARHPTGTSDPWTVPQSVRDRFVQDGHRFYFPDGAPAFRDQGRKLTTASENTQVVHSLVQIAQSRGWTEITVTGSQRFRQEAWRQARLAGLSVRGYKPDEVEQAHLIRALGRGRTQSTERQDTVVAEGASSPVRPEEPRASGPQVPRQAEVSRPARVSGKLLDHGRDAYRHDPEQDPSYFVRLQTPDGPREIWGKDIERAVAKSLTQPRIGDEVVLQRTGTDPVTVRRQARDETGTLSEKPVGALRNRWVIEKQAFFEDRAAAARVVSDSRIRPQDAVRERPELAGTYLTLRAAELASRSLRDPEDQRRFVDRVREVLVADIQHGEPLDPVRLRERQRAPSHGQRTRPNEPPTRDRPDLERML